MLLAPPLGAEVSFQYDLAGNLVTQSNTAPAAPPVFQEFAPRYVGVDSGGVLAISVPATGTGPFTYQWLFNGVALGGSTNDSLLLANATALNLGKYQLVASNSGGAVTSGVVNVSFFDPNGSGLPVAWELAYFGVTGVDPNADPDGDDVSNYQEFLDGTDPTSANSVMPRLYIIPTDPAGGTVSVIPLKPKYQLGDTVQITALPNPGWSFGGWIGSNAAPVSGSISNSNASLTVVMNSTKWLTPQFLSSVVAWGLDFSGQTDIPSRLGPVVAVAGGDAFSLALQADGTVAAWGDNLYGESVVPEGLSNVVAIAAGYDHSLALLSNGTVAAWGDDTYGETRVPAGLSNVVAIAAGGAFSLALQGNGTVAGWGANGSGQTTVPVGLHNVVAVSGGYAHSLALLGDGTVAGWGDNRYGETIVPAGLSNVVAIAAGDEFSLALQANGTVAAWGDNLYGESTVPEGLSNVVAIAAGGYHSLALQANGTVVAWGDNSESQIFVPPGLSNVVAIAGGGSHSLATFNDGSPVIVRQPINTYSYGGTTVLLSASVVGAPPLSYQWSLNGTNLLGATNATLTLTNVQPTISGVYKWVASNALGALTSAGSVLTVSNSAPIIVIQPANQAAPLGSNAAFSVIAAGSLPLDYQWQFNGTNIAGATQATLSLTNVAASNLGNYHVAVSNALGTTLSANAALVQVRSLVVVWGDNSYGQREIPPGLGDVVAVAAGRGNLGFSLALQADGTVAVWGYFGTGQYFEFGVPEGLSNVVAIAAGSEYSLALDKNGTVAAWDGDDFAQNTVPAGLSNVVAIAAGDSYSLALESNGTVMTWDENGSGQTTMVAGLSNVVAIAAGSDHSLALESDGTVVAWGSNTNGAATVPAGLSNVVAIAAGGSFSLALQGNGTVVAWGSNTNGAATVPAGLSNVVAIAAGFDFSLALQGNGTVVAWGDNTYGQTNVPAGLTNVVAIAGGGYNGIAIFTVGSAATTNSLVLGSNEFLANRQFQFTVSGGTTGQGYTLLASTNLLSWITLTSGFITNSPLQLSDPAATNYPRRFYRLSTP